MKDRSKVVKAMFTIGLLGMASLVMVAPSAHAALVGPATTDNSSISNQVRHQLATLPWYGVFDNLQYEVKGTEVILTGEVVSEHDQTKYDAGKAVKRIAGVTNVVNEIKVLPISSFDNQIRRAEYRTIFSNANLGRYTAGAVPQIHIIVNGGHVTLEGKVMNQMDRTIAGLVANSVPGVFSVTNNLTTS